MKTLVVILLSVALFSCKKAEDRKCFKSIGKNAERTVELPEFEKLMLREHMEFVLIHDTVNKLVITGGENVINFIHWNVNDDKMLEIKNENKCSFLRKLNHKIKVEIHFINMFNIHFEGTDSLTNIDTLDIPYFTLLIRDGSGSVNLKLNSIAISADISHGWGDYTLAGKTNYARIAARSNGYCDVLNLKIQDSIFVSSQTSGTMKVNANSIPLRGELKGNGDIWYWGLPSLINVNEFSAGKLVAKE